MEQLKPGTDIHIFQNGEIRTYTFLCIHPKNERYLLALNHLTQDADKLYIPYILGDTGVPVNIWCGPYVDSIAWEELRKYHAHKMALCIERRDKAK